MDLYTYSLFPSYNLSNQILELHNFWIDLILKPQVELRLFEKPFMNISGDVDPNSIEWFGDAISFKVKHPDQMYQFLIRILCINKNIIVQIPIDQKNHLTYDKQNLNNNHGEAISVGNYVIFSFDSGNRVKYKEEDLALFFQKSWDIATEWSNHAPKINRYLLKQIWDYNWIVHRINYFPAYEKIKYPFLMEYRKADYPLKIRHSPIIIEDIMWYRPDIARNLFNNMFDLCRESDGMIANSHIIVKDEKSQSIDVKKDYSLPQLPLWPTILLDYYKLSGDKQLIQDNYKKCKKNLEWWETNYFHQDLQMFFINSMSEHLCDLFEMPSSPRFYQQFDGQEWKKVKSSNRQLIPIDLNAMMADYYETMGIFGTIVEDPEVDIYFQKTKNLENQIQEYLWDDITNFFYDYDLELKQIQPLKTIAGFWGLFGGFTKKSQLNPIIKHLTDTNEFWTELPVPHIALNEKILQVNNSQSLVSLSQIFWLMMGLKRYNLNNIIGKLVQKTFTYINSSFELYHAIYDYYPAMSFNINSLITSKELPSIRSQVLSKIPLHSLFYRGILGGEILDDSINFIPDWSINDKDVNFSFYYRGQKIESFLDKSKKILEIIAPEQ